ncbi:MAG: DUF4290 domain-containing protein [Crocinitomicaceae bacterium]|tara:strand:+ start:483 stop:1124 length:642 start_codon:yes stop_codon:yes gene_type:complete
MEYNTTREKLILPEYGRNVQNMITHAMDLRDRSERNSAAQAIIEVMGQLNPHLRDVDDYRPKLWTHLFVMSDFKLDVDSPYEIPNQEVLSEKPGAMVYPKGKIKYGHYGKYTEKILSDSKEIEDPEAKEALKISMANFMKMQYLTHNNNAVENNVIAENIKELSNNELVLENPDDLTSTNVMLRNIGQVKKTTRNNNNNNSNNYKSKKKRFKR